MPQLLTQLCSSLVKVFPDEAPKAAPLTAGSALIGEMYSFQLAWCFPESTRGRMEISVKGCPGPASVRNVECVPAMMPLYPNHDEDVLRTEPGLFPDVLRPSRSFVAHRAGVWHSAWITVEVKKAGVWTPEVICTLEGEELARNSFTMTVVNAVLPPQTLYYTNWFHVDGITGYYHVSPWSEACWDLVEAFMKMAAEYGQNMILTPVFTPALDTAVGTERENVQLVEITRQDGVYSFNFDRLHRWIACCRKVGITELEISHFFSQWGAKCAPNIYATDNGTYRRIFGWETEALGEEYTSFLCCLIPALLAFLKQEGMAEHSWFHASDEPEMEHLEQYMKVNAFLKPLLPGCHIMDAMSNYEIYEEAKLSTPIPGSNHIEPFLEHEVPDLWTYYCCGQHLQVSNRFLAFPSARNRVFGLQLYKFRIAGFLQWGYNFYNSMLSLSKIDPYRVTDAGEAFPAGDAFVVYPGENGPLASIRIEVFREALQDQRALQLAEQLAGREAVMTVLEEGIPPITFKEYPHGDNWLLDVRERINALIQSKIEG